MLYLNNFEKAIFQLEEALEYYHSDVFQKDMKLLKHLRAAVIQAFEYTYELSHKMLKRHLESTSAHPSEIDRISFQDLIRTGAEKGLLLNSWDVWRKYRDARNITSHTYDEKKSEDVLKEIPLFVTDVKFLCEQLQKYNIVN